MADKKVIVFIVKSQKEVAIPFASDVRKFPIHEHYLTQVNELTFIYKYSPDSSLDEEKYIEFLKRKFKKKYNALTVDHGTLEQYLKI